MFLLKKIMMPIKVLKRIVQSHSKRVFSVSLEVKLFTVVLLSETRLCKDLLNIEAMAP